ncbi:MAG: hypothetical protein V1773_07755 [bacterium]
MKQSILLWFTAFVLTLGIAIYQRTTGPTYPISGKYIIEGKEYKYKFTRSGTSSEDCKVLINIDKKNISGFLFYKRYKTEDSFTTVQMSYLNGNLSCYLPKQPSAGKLQYFVVLNYNNTNITLPDNKNVVIRFKDDVPLWLLIPHVILMFGAMLLSTRTGLEYFKKVPKVNKLTIITLGFLIVGGFILGPLVQKYAFGVLWSGVPYGYDLTDNKMLITFIGWLAAFLMYKKSKNPAKLALIASILLVIIYLIPHSVLGSELDYNKLDKQQKQEKILDTKKTGGR